MTTLVQVKKILEEHRVPKRIYSLKGGLPEDSYCIDHVYDRWEVYYVERGKREELRVFNTEHDACNHLLKILEKTGRIKKRQTS